MLLIRKNDSLASFAAWTHGEIPGLLHAEIDFALAVNKNLALCYLQQAICFL